MAVRSFGTTVLRCVCHGSDRRLYKGKTVRSQFSFLCSALTLKKGKKQPSKSNLSPVFCNLFKGGICHGTIFTDGMLITEASESRYFLLLKGTLYGFFSCLSDKKQILVCV